MTQTIKLRRSASSGSVPSTGSLELGEVAINTYDGLVFIKKDDGTESIVRINDRNTDDLSEGNTNLYFTGQRVLDTINGNPLSTIDYIDFAPDEDLAYAEGRLYYHDEYKTLTMYNDVNGVSLQLGLEEWVRVYNGTGSTIANGTPCRPVGVQGENQSVAPAIATSAGGARVLGVATHDIPTGTSGILTVRGLVSGINTSGLTAGQPVFLNETGGLQNAAPTYPYYPTQIGGCIVSDATNGYIYVSPSYDTLPQLRVTGNTHVDGNITVDGNLTVNGTQSVVSQNNLAIDNSFVYLNSGDTIGDANTTFTGSGLDDAYFIGHFEGTTSKTYYVRIDGVGTGTGGVDTFEWSYDNFSTTEATGVDLAPIVSLGENISIQFNANTGHTSGDKWSGTASPVNTDSGWFSNRNTGTSGIGYTHMGIFFDISDEKFKVVSEYEPEPEGTINTGDASFTLGTLVVDDLEAVTVSGSFTGNISGNVIGNVTGTVSSIANHDTDDLSEGTTNLYHTSSRVQGVVTKAYVEGLGVSYNSLSNKPTIPTDLSDLNNDMWEVTSTVPTDGTGKPAGYVWYIV